MFGRNNNEPGNLYPGVKSLAISGLALVLGACGGGGGGGGGTSPTQPPPPPPVSNQRILESVMDYDNNGQIDARFDYTYYADGRIENITYTYIGDGTPDIYVPYYSGMNVTTVVNSFNYDANGNLDNMKLDFDNGALVNDLTYTFNGSQLVQMDGIVTVPGTTVTLLGIMSYQNGLPDQYDLTSNGVNPTVFNYTYNANNQIIQEVRNIGGTLNPVTRIFDWNPDGSLDKITTTDSNSTNVEDLIYAGGQLVQRDYTFSLPPTGPDNTNVSWMLTYNAGVPARIDYDLNMDGSIDGTLTITMENGPCTPVYFNITDEISQAGNDGIPGSANGVAWCS